MDQNTIAIMNHLITCVEQGILKGLNDEEVRKSASAPPTHLSD